MNRENYDKKILTTFNVIGCYFVNHFYNSLYRRAKRFHEKYGKSSLTDEYKKVIRVYAEDATSKESLYKEMVKDLYKYYQSTTRTTIFIDVFTDRVLEHFLPEEHFGVMTDAEKNFFLHKILESIIGDFSVYVTSIGALHGVIDDHPNHANTKSWLNNIIDIQMLLREKLYQEFVRKGRKQTVDLETFQKLAEDRDKLMEKLREVVSELVMVKSELSNAKKIVEHMTNENIRLSGLVSSVRSSSPQQPQQSHQHQQPPQPQPRPRGRPPKATPMVVSGPSNTSNLITSNPPNPITSIGGAKRRSSGEVSVKEPSSPSDNEEIQSSPPSNNPFTDDVEDS